MSLPVSAAFIAAANADANRPISKVQLVLGNYASASAYGTTVVSSGDDGSGNYPATGAIDGDRTEINVGAASGADNDIGKSSWRSSGVPDNGDTVTLDITFSKSRTINRVKLYHLAGHALKTFKLSYWTGSAWTVFAATSDVVAGGQTSITTTGTLDTVHFPDIATTKVRLQVTATSVALDKANVVEMEVYRLVDITSRVSSAQVQRQRDYKLGSPLATKVMLTGINDDRFFSFSHVPTSDEVAAGFINNELQPGMGLLVSYGFSLSSADELASSFVGTVDRIQLRPKTRDVVIEGRDGMKTLINKIDSSKLKSSSDIGANVQYVLNRANISNYEMHVDTTSITIDYFFTDQQNQLSTIQDLVQAAGDALFYFDENGFAVFKFFSTSVPLQHIYTSQADWNAGTLTATDADTIPGELIYKYAQAQTWNDSAAGWTVVKPVGAGTFGSDGTGVFLTTPISATSKTYAYRAQTQTVGEWRFDFVEDVGNAGGFHVYVAIMATGVDVNTTQGVPNFTDAYVLDLFVTSNVFIPNEIDVSLTRFHDGGIQSPVVAAVAVNRDRGNAHSVIVRRSASGAWNIYYDGTLIGSGIDNNITAPGFFGYETDINAFFATTANKIWFKTGTLKTPTTTDGVGTWVSPALDMTATVNSLGILQKTDSPDTGTVTYWTATSADNVTYDPYVQISGNGQINSIVRRYMKTKAIVTFTGIGASPAVLDITVNWTAGVGSVKYPAAPSSATFRFDSTMMDIQQEIADNLGGDTAILNDVTVQAQPLVLTGTDADVQFQGTVGTPPSQISGSTPLSVTNGDIITIAPVLSGGMDVSRMSGANPAAAAITFAGGATGSWVFSSIHPTLPILVITITHTGTITNLQIQGKKFSNATYLQAQNVKNAASIATYGDRRLSISNQWITSTSLAASIAATLVANAKSPTSYIPSSLLRPMWYVQIGDRVTVVDVNLDLSADYIIVGKSDKIQSTVQGGDAGTAVTLLKVPAGS